LTIKHPNTREGKIRETPNLHPRKHTQQTDRHNIAPMYADIDTNGHTSIPNKFVGLANTQ